MTKEKFTEILKEYDYNDKQIEMLWLTRPDDDIKEDWLRNTAAHLAPIKDQLIQR